MTPDLTSPPVSADAQALPGQQPGNETVTHPVVEAEEGEQKQAAAAEAELPGEVALSANPVEVPPLENSPLRSRGSRRSSFGNNNRRGKSINQSVCRY